MHTFRLLIIIFAAGLMDSIAATDCSAVVLYDEEKIPPHHRPELIFSFGDLQFKIKQSWEVDGVAGVVWDAAVVLGEYIKENEQIVRGRKVLELGAGTGLAGMCAWKLGAQVTLTDKDSVLNALRDNLQINSKTEPVMESNDNSHSTGSCADNSKVRCGEDNSWNEYHGASVQELDWSDRDNELFNHKWDLVIGADIIYIEESFPHLLDTMKQLQTDYIFLSCRLRYDKDHKFIELTKNDFDIEKLLYDEIREVHVFKFTRNFQ